jgi:hypothetical protein
MGHDSMQAAIIYQHATAEADARIVAALDAELSGVEASSEAVEDDGQGLDDDTAEASVKAGE